MGPTDYGPDRSSRDWHRRGISGDSAAHARCVLRFRRRPRSEPPMAHIPGFVVEYFLLGRTRRGAVQRFTQDGGISTDVWLAFARDTTRSVRVLVAPVHGVTTVDLAFVLHNAIAADRRKWKTRHKRQSTTVSPLENFVAAWLYFDDVMRVALPLTSWWHRKGLFALQRTAFQSGTSLDEALEHVIRARLAGDVDTARASFEPQGASALDRRILEAAPLAALIGVFRLATADPEVDVFESLRADISDGRSVDDAFAAWVEAHAEAIARHARTELSLQYEGALIEASGSVCATRAKLEQAPNEPAEMIQRMFLDRQATLSETEGLRTIKADAASRVFDVSCTAINWAVIDSGIAAGHPAFLEHGKRDRDGRRVDPPPSRVRCSYDFTRIERIRNFDLTLDADGSAARKRAIADVVEELAALPGRAATPEWKQTATANLATIARQLEQRIPPDWALIEPLIRVHDPANADALVSDHGTHVAGILGADWRDAANPGPDGRGAVLLQGVCPDIGIVDLRVIHPLSRTSSEFALLAALEFVQFMNTRSGASGLAVHGVNVSLSIPHDVRNYGCGATPVCVACNRLSSSGVVVVAAAGNRGWNEQDAGFGNFVYCSITDPGNAQEVITVGSTHRLRPHSFGVSYFSSRGPTGDGRLKPDLVAPGEQIRGPVRGGADDELDGTSMASPFVSGAAAMLLARHRELLGNPVRVKQILCATATDLGRERYFQGHGLVDVLRALQSV
ncbi:MAG: hypothetical protein EPO68_05275 [Planctomycetota bacterium]|nr:MAG: hypothetical protein EPO68_05275 [Planctomycetota bacterium]